MLPSRFLSAILLLSAVPVHAEGTWNQFRGPSGNGHAEASGLPVEWSADSNILWKTLIPNKGWSTPLIHKNQVWLTSATPDGHDFFVHCLDQATGKLQHESKLLHSETPESLGNDLNSYASPTGVIEDGRVYLHFGSYGTVCLDTLTFKEIWRRTDLPCRHYRGPGSSLLDWKDTIILTMDGVDVQYLCALDKKSGATRWKTDRATDFDDLGPDGKPVLEGDYRKAYSTPVLISPGGKNQIVSSGSKATVSYDPDTGKELWRVTYKGFSNASLPAWHDGTVAINTGHGKAMLRAYDITATSTGDITSTLKWEQTKGIPTRSSPVTVEGIIYMNGDGGILSAVDFKDGSLLYTERVMGTASSSPLYAGGMLFFCNEQGTTTILKPGRSFQKLGSGTLDSGIMASPVAAHDTLYLRTKTALYAIRQKK